MAQIKLLDENTINQIAAGEVVERPASVIKELVENAIDARANQITVEVKDGGLKLIRITDNGFGMAKEDVRTAFLRHSTSKIRAAKDLITIDSLGFRGEALASIAAVSMMELLTKEPPAMMGSRYRIEGGNEVALEEVGCPSGTTFIVKDLFYNTPARLKFMKSPSTELGYITDLMSKLAMGHPEVGFKFISNNTVKLQTAGNDRLKDCIYAVYGKEVARNLIPIEQVLDGITIKGFIGKPHISRGNRTYENYYINGRYIKSKIIERAIEDSFKSRLMQHRYPFVTLHIHIDAALVDVNVHPTKMEVRFSKEEWMYQGVLKAISEGLAKQELILSSRIEEETPEVKQIIKKKDVYEPFVAKETVPTYKALDVKLVPKQEGSINLLPKKEQGKVQSNLKSAIDRSFGHAMAEANRGALSETKLNESKLNESKLDESRPTESVEINAKDPADGGVLPVMIGEQVDLVATGFVTKEKVVSHKIVGQLFDTYWIVEMDNQYYIIDQHAAHEKVLYERLVKEMKATVVPSQRLLTPVVAQLSMLEKQRYEQYKTLFVEMGFEIDDFGDDALIVRSVPFVFDEQLSGEAFIQMLDELNEKYAVDKTDHLKDIMATKACKAAVKGNDRLTLLEYEGLIKELLTLDDPFHCPHGRPTIISMSRYELEKKFKRIV